MTSSQGDKNFRKRIFEFNTILKTFRSAVKRSIGQLKRCFNCLQSELWIQPDEACLIIVACVILHNIAKMLDKKDFEVVDNI